MHGGVIVSSALTTTTHLAAHFPAGHSDWPEDYYGSNRNNHRGKTQRHLDEVIDCNDHDTICNFCTDASKDIWQKAEVK